PFTLLRGANKPRHRRASLTRSAIGQTALPSRSNPEAINGCSVNRQLSMTRAQAMAPHFRYWRQAWLDCPFSQKTRARLAGTMDEDRADTSADLLPCGFDFGSQRVSRGDCLSPHSGLHQRAPPRKPMVARRFARLEHELARGAPGVKSGRG